MRCLVALIAKHYKVGPHNLLSGPRCMRVPLSTAKDCAFSRDVADFGLLCGTDKNVLFPVFVFSFVSSHTA